MKQILILCAVLLLIIACTPYEPSQLQQTNTLNKPQQAIQQTGQYPDKPLYEPPPTEPTGESLQN